tara:strand:- start:1174 stop:2727 length:1554 start_codon:yes stop_codon:yes gene_type:complete
LTNLFNKNYFSAIYLIILGSVSSLSLPPYNYFIINFITFSLFFIFIFNKKNRINKNLPFFKYGWYFGFGYFLSSLYWISIALTFDEHFKYFIPFAVILVPSFLAIFYGLVTYFFSIFYSDKIISSFLIFTLLFGITELIRGFIFTGFPWNLIAFSFSDNNNFIQILSILGTYSFNLICISFFTSPAVLILKRTRKELLVCSFFVFIAVSFLIFGKIKNNQFDELKYNKHKYTVRIVSPNIKLNRFYSDKDEVKIINELIYLSNPNPDKLTIFVWPEGIISGIYSNDFKIYEDLFSKSFSKNHLIILGINSFESKNDEDLYFNSLAVFDNNLNLVDSYKKVKLVPFGEFLPFENLLSLIGFKTITNNYQSYSSGKKIRSINLNLDNFNLNFLPLICYEIIYSGKLYKNSKFDYIINISEDGWFGNSIGPKQHFVHGIFRSIESGKYIIRSANNGISAVIAPSGKIDKKVVFRNTGYIDFVESKTVKTTLFSKYGNKIFILLILLYIFLIFSFNRIKNE